jgi:hypothetical protein
LDSLGPNRINPVAYLELGLAKQVSILLGGQQSCQGPEVVVGATLEYLANALGLGFLLGGELRWKGHG